VSAVRPLSFAPAVLAPVFALFLASAPADAAAGDLTGALAGAWELANPKASRSCRLTLGADAAPGGHVLGAPPACRIAMPLLVQVSAWTINPDKSISLMDGAGKSVVDFHPSGNSVHFTARAGADNFVLTPVTGAKDADRTGSIAAALSGKDPAGPAKAGAEGVRTAAAELTPLRPDALVGVYGVAREKNKPVCSIELTPRPLKKGGLFTAVLSGGCIDTGLKVFDPIAWRTDKGLLYLIARKGHEQSFAAGTDGIFAKEPPSGSQLFLKKQ
jgi:hypothetical protein